MVQRPRRPVRIRACPPGAHRERSTDCPRDGSRHAFDDQFFRPGPMIGLVLLATEYRRWRNNSHAAGHSIKST
jgi:hypothetical protein